jgi:uncharacterized protein YecE (DUF72 family)
MRIKVGLCGWTININEYFERYPVVEVQQTFYQPPAVTTMARWREAAPPGFEFTLKAWQLITHEAHIKTYSRLKRPLSEKEKRECGAFRWSEIVLEAWQTTVRCAETLRATSVLFQCPASFKPTDENVARLRTFFEKVERGGLRFLWEPRGTWPQALLESLCRDLRLVHVVDPFTHRTVTPEFIYYRLHGIGSHRHTYSDDELKQLIARIGTPDSAYIMFNEIPRDNDSARFIRLLGTLPV